MARLSGGRRLRHEHAGVLRRLPERSARQPTVRGRANDLPARPVRMGRRARQAADRLLDRADLRPERAPGLPPRVGRELPRLEAQRGGREPRPMVEDRIHHRLRRERRHLRPRCAAAPAGRHRRTSSSSYPASRTGRSAAASGCPASSSRPGPSAALSPQSSSTTPPRSSSSSG